MLARCVRVERSAASCDRCYFTEFAPSQQVDGQQVGAASALLAGAAAGAAAHASAQQQQHGHSSHGHSMQHSGGQLTGVQQAPSAQMPLMLESERAEPLNTATMVVIQCIEISFWW